MTSHSIIEVIELLLSLAMLLWFFRGPWQSLLVDMTRQRLFEARDNIFLYAADGKINFNSETYIRLREFFNESIRACHNFRLIVLISSRLSEPKKTLNAKKTASIFDVISDIKDIECRNSIKNILIESGFYMILLLVLRSPLVLLLLIIATPFMLIGLLLKGSTNQFVDRMAPLIERNIKLDDLQHQ
jgi:hypothetical protein